MKCLVSGANGVAGSYMAKLLVEKGCEVRALVRETSNLDLLANTPVELVYGDLVDSRDLDQQLNGVDVVYHIAAVYRDENLPQKYFFAANVDGTRKLLESANRVGVKRFLHCSTIGVQGDIKNPPATEETQTSPGDHYQASKWEAEKMVLEFFREHDLWGTVIRPAGIYGPGDLRFLKLFRFINSGRFRMIGNGKTLFHMVYASDLVEGMWLAANTDAARNEVFTIAGERYLTLTELVEKIARILDRPISRVKIPVAPVWLAGLICEFACKPFGIPPPIYRRRVHFFTKSRAFDISKARRVLGYEPQVAMDDGLARTAAWYRQRELL